MGTLSLDLDKLERLAEAATPGPWRVESEVCRGSMGLFWPISSIEGAEDNVTENVTTGDAAYIVEACNSLPKLIEMYRNEVEAACDADKAWQNLRKENLALEARVRELERQREWMAKLLGDLCTTQKDGDCPLFYTCPASGFGWSCGITIKTKEDWIYAAEQAAKEAGE